MPRRLPAGSPRPSHLPGDLEGFLGPPRTPRIPALGQGPPGVPGRRPSSSLHPQANSVCSPAVCAQHRARLTGCRSSTPSVNPASWAAHPSWMGIWGAVPWGIWVAAPRGPAQVGGCEQASRLDPAGAPPAPPSGLQDQDLGRAAGRTHPPTLRRGWGPRHKTDTHICDHRSQTPAWLPVTGGRPPGRASPAAWPQKSLH